MQRKLFLKTILRQPVRTLALVLLIAAASFAATLRTVEYIAINNHINEITAHFRSIGYLQASAIAEGDITTARAAIAASPYIDFEDVRHGSQGILLDMLNADTEASFFGGEDSSFAFSMAS